MADYFKIKLDVNTQEYIDDDIEPTITVDLNKSQVFEELLALSQTYVTCYTINEKRHNDILSFLDSSDLVFNRELIYNSIFWLNQSYFESVQLSNSFIIYSLDKEPKELKTLEDIFSIYFGEGGLNLESITFKFDHKTNEFDRKINNKLVMLDIMNAIRNQVFTKAENDSIPVKRHTNRPKYIKHVTATALLNHLTDQNPQSSKKSFLRFIIDFFHRAQVPVSVADNALESTDPELIANLLARWCKSSAKSVLI